MGSNGFSFMQVFIAGTWYRWISLQWLCRWSKISQPEAWMGVRQLMRSWCKMDVPGSCSFLLIDWFPRQVHSVSAVAAPLDLCRNILCDFQVRRYVAPAA